MSAQAAAGPSPLVVAFIAITVMLTLGYFWGRRKNRRICVNAFQDLVRLTGPTDQTFTNIGGTIGYHANLTFGRKHFLSGLDATLTLLPRQSLLYLPISLAIRGGDRLYVSLHLRGRPFAESHLVEAGHARTRAGRIANRRQLEAGEVRWGHRRYLLYAGSAEARTHLEALVRAVDHPGPIRHVAVVPHHKRCFVLMAPGPHGVAQAFAPVYRWLQAAMTDAPGAPGEREAAQEATRTSAPASEAGT